MNQPPPAKRTILQIPPSHSSKHPIYLPGDGDRTGIALTNPCLVTNSTKRQMIQNKKRNGQQSLKEGYLSLLFSCQRLVLAFHWTWLVMIGARQTTTSVRDNTESFTIDAPLNLKLISIIFLLVEQLIKREACEGDQQFLPDCAKCLGVPSRRRQNRALS